MGRGARYGRLSAGEGGTELFLAVRACHQRNMTQECPFLFFSNRWLFSRQVVGSMGAAFLESADATQIASVCVMVLGLGAAIIGAVAEMSHGRGSAWSGRR